MVAQFIRIESKFGQWYAKIFNFETNHVQIIRCDKNSIVETSNVHPKILKELLKSTTFTESLMQLILASLLIKKEKTF